MILFISGGELVFVFFIVLLVFGADKIPSIARGLAKGMTQVRQATNEIKSEIQKNTKFKDPSKNISKELNDSVGDIKKDFDDMGCLAPLGEINPNFDYLIIDEQLKKVSPGNKGELYLIGPNVALGYYNDKERTDSVFIQNPIRGTYKDIVYKTGDIVYEKNGLLYFAGRIDNQIKHMGYRIELEEVEVALNSLVDVNQSAVLYERVKENYGKIIAFVATEADITESNIKLALKNILPNYMIPNIIKIRAHLPRNKNGKIDKLNLRKGI